MTRVIDSIVSVLGGTACLAGLLVLVRRAVGAIHVELTGPGLLAVAGAGIALVTFTDAVSKLPSTRAIGLVSRCAARAGLAAAFAALLGLTHGGPATVAAALATLTAIAWPAAASFSWEARPWERTAVAEAGDAMPAPPAHRADPPDGRLVQRLERFERTLEDGTVIDAARGRASARFAEGSRMAVIHVGFCPPFEKTPQVGVSCDCEGLELAVTAAEVLPWGARIECRLEEPAEEAIDVEVEFHTTPK